MRSFARSSETPQLQSQSRVVAARLTEYFNHRQQRLHHAPAGFTLARFTPCTEPQIPPDHRVDSTRSAASFVGSTSSALGNIHNWSKRLNS
mgnify:CR=1 FL=1